MSSSVAAASSRPRIGRRSLCVGLLLLAIAACGEPCRELALKVCDCAADEGQRQQCIGRVNAQVAQQGAPDAAAQAACTARLEGCSCAALAAGSPQRCGLSREDLATP